MGTQRNITRVDIPVLLCSTFLLILVVIDGSFGLLEAIIFLAFFAAYMYYILTGTKEKTTVKTKLTGVAAGAALIGGLLLVIVGAKFLIDAVVAISLLAGISTAIISASVVAFGTSMPEAVVTIVAAIKKKKDIAIGNIVGSNIFNVLFIMGAAGLFGSLAVDRTLLVFALPMLVVATFMLWFVIHDKKITRWEGAMLLILYAFFIAKLYVW